MTTSEGRAELVEEYAEAARAVVRAELRLTAAHHELKQAEDALQAQRDREKFARRKCDEFCTRSVD